MNLTSPVAAILIARKILDMSVGPTRIADLTLGCVSTFSVVSYAAVWILKVPYSLA